MLKTVETVVHKCLGSKDTYQAFCVSVCACGDLGSELSVYMDTWVTDVQMVAHPLILTEILGNCTEMRCGFEKEHLRVTGEWGIKREF